MIVLSLFYSRKWLISKKTIIFQGSRGGPTFSRGGGVQLFPGWGVPIAYSYRKYITCDFAGEVRTPCPPLDPHLGLSMVLSIHAEKAPNLRFVSGSTGGQTDRQTDGCTDGRRKKQYPSDFIGGKPVMSTGYLVSCSRTQRSASGEARTRNPSISDQALPRLRSSAKHSTTTALLS